MNGALHCLKNLTVLIAEDDEVVLAQNVQTLQIFFKRVLKASNGLSAFYMYQDEKPDIIITDVKMPGMGGLEFVKKVRRSDYETPIILLTAYSDQQTLLEAVNLKIDGYLVKPVLLDALVSVLRKCVEFMRLEMADYAVTFADGSAYNVSTKELIGKENRPVDLGHKEQELLAVFLNAPTKTVSKDEIIRTLYPLEEITDSALKSILSRMRKKIGFDNIVNIKGAGWRLSLKN